MFSCFGRRKGKRKEEKSDDTSDSKKDIGAIPNDLPTSDDTSASKKDIGVISNDPSTADVPRKDTKDAPHSGVPVVSPPHVDDQISDGPNQRNNNPALHYAVLETLPEPTNIFVEKDNSHTPYAVVAVPTD